MATKSIPAIFALACILSSCRTSPVALRNLKCDGRENAAGVAASGPRFSWEIVSDERGQGQSAYQILVATRLESLSEGRSDVWDSGKKTSAQSAFVPYEGPELAAGTEYIWRVRIWDGKGRPARWSEPASFITGLPGVPDWEGARWIAYEELPDSLKVVPGVHGFGDNLEEAAVRRPVIPLFRKEFEVSGEVRKAIVFVSGLGHYELRVNGKKAGDGFLAPGWTDYRKTCLYNILDVTSLVREGRNAVGLIVGNGFFNINRERYRKLVIAHGTPTAIVKLGIEYASGKRETIVSGPDWKAGRSPITFSSIYGGEDYDARLEQPGWDMPSFDDAAWKNALSSQGPGGALKAESDYPLKIMEVFENARVTEPRGGNFVYDFGQNASGIIRLAVKGRSGQQVKMVPGEILDPDGCVTQKASGRPYCFLYTLKGAGEEEWAPRFTYYGFRYVQVENAVPDTRSGQGGRPALEEPPGGPGAEPGNADDEFPRIVRLHLLHTRNSAPVAGSFECSNELFNRIFRLIRWAIQSNLASVPTDCPHREKLGWLEQAYLMGNSIQYNFHIEPLY
ncbi:MAG TPA: family 78 glycoside hydrolase catalytic domain, partial [Candidatus Aminicenantes bacterium]|nr:family 78 glycoside hydrolase catalytic domain [Candidatus Aminicenantes bacterium]